MKLSILLNLCATLLTTLVIHKTHAALPFTSQYGMITYWGQNKAVNVISDTTKQEMPLDKLCDLPQYDVVVLSFMMDHFATKNQPSMDFSSWCNAGKNAYTGYSISGSGTTMLSCPTIGTWIKSCQSKGKKVLLGINPHSPLDSESDGTISANNVWNIFLGGSSNIKPFGTDVKLDGVDLFVRNNNNVGYKSFISTLRSNMNNDFSKSYYISVSPLCAYDNERLIMQPVISDQASNIDWINVMFLASNPCTWTANNAGFWSNLQQWNTMGINLFTGLVGVGYNGYEARADGMNGDFIDPLDFQNSNVMANFKSNTKFSGVTIYDGSFESIQPCNTTTQSYSQVIYEQMTLPAYQSGVNTATKCYLKPGLFPTSTRRSSCTDPAACGPDYSFAAQHIVSKHVLFGMLFGAVFLLF